MAKRRERPIPRINPSGERVWIARPTDPSGKRHYRGTFKLKREAQDAIDAAYEEWDTTPVARDTVGAYAADWTERRPRSKRTDYDRNSKLRQVLDVKVGPQAARLAVRQASPQPCPRPGGPHAQAPAPCRGGGKRSPAGALSDD